MKRFFLFAVTAFLCLQLSAKKALVVIAHGSPSEYWNQQVLALEPRLRALELPGIDYIRVALMEFAQPDITSVMRDCEREGVDTVFALPLFISPSGHSEDDIPNILGLKFNPDVREELAEEGIEIVRTGMHIILGPTLMDSGVIEKAMAERVKKLSTDPDREALILLAHGDGHRAGFWQRILKRCEDSVRAEGFSYVDYQLVGMGQHFAKDVTPLLERARSERERILVQGIYLVSNVGAMARRAGMEQLASTPIAYGEAGILPESIDEVTEWIVKTVKAWQENN